MKKILIINTGGTFNKRYNPLTGELEVPVDSKALENILQYFHNLNYEIKNILHKDSLDMQDNDRKEIVDLIKHSPQSRVLIIHGTDTMDKTAEYLEKHIENKKIILTGAMVPFSIDTIEANANLSMAIGSLVCDMKNGIYIAMHGLIDDHKSVYKNRKKGLFESSTCKG